MDKQITEIVTKALDGTELKTHEIAALLSVHYLSEESYLIQYAARQMAAEAAKGLAEVHAQVGMNVGPCPKDCQFCSFAPVNKVFPEEHELSVEEIIHRSIQFEQDGANAIYLMTTATYKLSRYCEAARAVRDALKPETPMIANVDDFEEDGARELLAAGFVGIYHVLRMGEGKTTRIPPSIRLRTFAVAQAVGLKIGTCVEPVGPEHTPLEIAERSVFARGLMPVHGGSGRRMRIPGSPLAPNGYLNKAEQRLLIAAVKLAFGYSVAGHAGLNLSWAESGANPRDTKADTTIGSTVAIRRKNLEEEGWKVLDGPSKLFS